MFIFSLCSSLEFVGLVFCILIFFTVLFHTFSLSLSLFTLFVVVNSDTCVHVAPLRA